jgi:hypothetical protein
MIRPFSKPRPVNVARTPRLFPREFVTLCVAAECQRYKRFFSAVVFATDFQVEGEIASAQIGTKFGTITNEEYPVLMAGTQTRAVSFASVINTIATSRQTPHDKDNQPLFWDAILSDSVRSYKYSLADEVVSGRFGMSYGDLLKVGKVNLPDDVYRETITEISRMPLDCWLLLLGFAHNHPTLYRISNYGVVESCENFAAIGSGSYIAEASLFQRSQSSRTDLGTTIYNVYEAMRLGAIAPGVGDKFQIGVAEWDWFEQPNPHNRGEVKISFLAPQYYQYLAKRFARFGPKPITTVRIKPRFIKERERSLVLTPKGEADPKVQRDIKRTRIAREREARKRAARQSVSQSPKPAQ